MRRLSLSIVLVLSACGSSQDQGDGADLGDASQTGGSQQASGGGGSMRVDAGSGGASGKGGTSGSGGSSGGGGATGTGGKVGSGGSTGTGGASASGGSTGTGGSSGTGGTSPVDAGAPDVVVGQCDALGAEGVWQKIIPSAQSVGPAISVALDPLHAGTVYSGVGTASGGPTTVWKSTDCGANWVNIATGRNGTVLNSGGQWEIQVDPTNSDVYADSGYGGNGLYRSTNGGVDWDDITPKGAGIPSFVQHFSIDPTDHKHIVLGFHNNCTGAYAPMCFAETTDGATTWRFVVGPTQGWGEGAGPAVIGGSAWLYAAPFDGLYYTGNAGAAWEKVVGYAGCYDTLIKPAATYYLGCYQNNGIQKSADGHTWSLLANSPQATGVVATGTYLYASFQNDSSGVHRAPLSDPTAWTTLPTPSLAQGSSDLGMVYDPHHQLLYLASWSGGIWRVVTP